MRIVNPKNGSLLHEVEEDTDASIREKVERARSAQRAWAERPYAERAAVLAQFRQLVIERTEPMARILSAEVGKPITQSRNELKGLLGRLDFFLESTAAELSDEVVAGADTGTEERIRHEPLGVIANISAWNYPYFVGANVFVPALLTGNAVVYKPSEYATLTGRAIADALAAAGVPDGVFSTVIGGGAVGARLLEEHLRGVFFTGSFATGSKIAAAMAPRMVRVQLELGGKDPAYVCDDVDVPAAAAALADGAFYNAGQSCCAVERIYVHEKIFGPFAEEFAKTVRGFAVGDPDDEATYIGPLARREAAIEHLTAQVADARERGARVRVGGGRREGPGFYFEPTVLVDVDHQMAVMREETIGPHIGLMPARSDEHALELMADTEYGLTAAVYGKDRERAEGLLRRLDVGSAYFNCCDRVSPRLPWSGRRHSGIGCTLSSYGIEAFLVPKAYHLRMG
jgi:acyl-CoA reductase-like NAD-dependent aldehyde dehydrogenase